VWWWGGNNEYWYPQWTFPSWWLGSHDLGGAQKGWITEVDGAPGFPAWFLIWLFIAKCHAVLLNTLRIPPPLQLVLLMLAGIFLCDHGWGWNWGWNRTDDKAAWLKYPFVAEFIGQGLWFYDLGGAVYLVFYVGSIYYADPLIKKCIELSKSTSNVLVACVALIGLLELHFFSMPVRVTTTSMNDWATNAEWVTSAEEGFSNFNFFQSGWRGAESQHSSAWRNMWGFVKVLGFDFLWNIFLWPTVVALKAVIFGGAPFHLRWIGTTTLGAYIIHPYLPLWTPQAYTSIIDLVGQWPHIAGDGVAKFLFFVLAMLYAVLIQYSLGIGVHKVFIALILRMHALCRWLYTQAAECCRSMSTRAPACLRCERRSDLPTSRHIEKK